MLFLRSSGVSSRTFHPGGCLRAVAIQGKSGAKLQGPCVCTVGDELVFGERESNGNERWLLRKLFERGIPARMAAQLPDEVDAIAEFVKFAKSQGMWPILVAGGLGGTHDDCTREGVSVALGRPLCMHPECHEMLSARYAASGLDFNIQRQRMAMLPEGCTLMANPRGSPGFAVDGVFAFPGFPSMMQPMVLALLDSFGSQFNSSSSFQEEVILPVLEGTIAPVVEAFSKANPGLKVGIYPSDKHFGQQCKLVLRFRADASDRAHKEAVLKQWEELLADCCKVAGVSRL